MRQLVVVPTSPMFSWTIGDAQTDDAGVRHCTRMCV
jgi:hypothetical protein